MSCTTGDRSGRHRTVIRSVVSLWVSVNFRRDPLPLSFPVRFLQGTADEDVDMSVAQRLLDHADGSDMRLTLVDGADHRFSDDACLALIAASVEDVLAAGG